ncbi:hypothetical protein [Winogradskyella sp. MIT101101]|uniref:hypothetical protein n=1 Tax=Winogradskyella sp. MIT101101 TaxID=3098297 RepID=UPI00399AC65E
MKFKLFQLILISFSLTQTIVCQTKNEKEERVKVSEFPELAQTIIKALPKNCKRLRFYKETDGEKHSFEAKFKYKRQRYSLEFSVNGSIEDIEVITNLKNIKSSAKDSIKAYFKNSFTKYKLIKIQKQHVYTTEMDAVQFLNDVLSQKPKCIINYEIIAEVKTKKKSEIREFIFNSNGYFSKSRVLNPTSYEHVLY